MDSSPERHAGAGCHCDRGGVSFLRSFTGCHITGRSDPGMKLIAATCHYTPAGLDEGPIIEQDAPRIDDGDSVADQQRVGREVERSVLARGCDGTWRTACC